MVDIPIYRQQIRQAPAADTRLGIRTNADAMGAPIGEGVQALGRAAGTVAGVTDRMRQMEEEEFRKANQAGVAARNVDLQTKLIDIRREVRQTRGEAAAGLREKILPKFDAAADEIEKGLANDEQREAFKAIRQQQRAGLTEFADVHALNEWDAHQTDVFNNSGKVFAERVGQVFEDEGQLNAALWDRAQDVRRYGEQMGKGSEWIGTTGADEISRGIRIAIGKHLESGNYNAARGAFEKFHLELNDRDHAAVQPAIRAAVVDGESRRLSREIVDAAPAGPSPDTAAAEEAADRATQDAPEEIRAETKRRAVEGVRLKARAWSETQVSLEAQILAVATDPKRPLGMDDPDAQALLRRMDPLRARQLRAEVAKSSAVPVDPVRSRLELATYEIALATADDRTRNQILDAGPLINSATMTTEDRRSAVAAWGKAKMAKEDPEQKSWLTTREDVVNEALAKLGVDPQPYRTQGGKVIPNERAMSFRQQVERGATQLAQAGNRKTPNVEDVQRAVDKIIMNKVRMSSNEWWTAKLFDVYDSGSDTQRIAALVPAGQRGDAYVPPDDIPANHYAAIRDAIAAHHGEETHAATRERIKRAYAAVLMGDRALYDSIVKAKD